MSDSEKDIQPGGMVVEKDGRRFIRVVMWPQPSANTCVHACLNAVTGVPMSRLIERFGDRAIGEDEERCVLIENGIYPVPVDLEHVFETIGTYLATVPSLNLLGGTHRVVLLSDGFDVRVLDPNLQRDGVLAYPKDVLGHTYRGELRCRLFEIVKLDLFKLRYMEGVPWGV